MSPLSHALTGVGSTTAASLAALRGGRRAEVSVFAPRARRGERDPAALDRGPVETKLVVLPFAHHWRTASSRSATRRSSASSAASTSSISPTRCTRRSRRHALDDDPRPRADRAFPVDDARTRLDARGAKYRDAARTCDVIFTNSRTGRRRARPLGVPDERLRVAPPGVDAVPYASGRARRSRRPVSCSPSRRSSRADLGTLVDVQVAGAASLLARGRRRRGLGEQPDLAGPGVLPARGPCSDERLAAFYRGAAAFVFRSGSGLRDSRRRGDGVRRAGGRGLLAVAGRGSCGDAAVRADPRQRGVAREWHRACAGAARRARAARLSTTQRVVHVGACRRRSTGYAAAAVVIHVASDVTPLALTRAGRRRLRPRASRQSWSSRDDVEVVHLGFGAPGAPRRRPRHRLVCRRAAPGGEAARRGRAALPRRSRRRAPPPRAPTVVTVHDLALLRQPELSPRGCGHRRLRCCAASCARRAGGGRLTFHGAGGRRALRRAGGRVRVTPNGAGEPFVADGGRAEGDYVLRSRGVRAAQEPATRRRGDAAPGRELRVVGARGWGGVDAGRVAASPGWASRTTRRWPGSTAVRYDRVSVALRGVRPAGAGGAPLRRAGRDRAPAARSRRSSPTAPPSSSTCSTSRRSRTGSSVE